VPAGSADSSKSNPPGTGRYRLQGKDGAFRLLYDKGHPAPAPSLTTIELYGVNNSDALLYGLEMGNYQFAYNNLSGGEIVRVSAATAQVPTTNLIYLGMHSSKGALQDADFRAALAACIDHAAVVGDAWQSWAEPTDTPFPPRWHGLHAEDFARPYNELTARRALEDLGYTELKNGVRASRSRRLSFTLVVHKNNSAKAAAARAIRSQLRNFQIEVTIQSLNKSDYNDAIKDGKFDLYIGELRLGPDCGLSPLLISGGAATKGVQVWGKASSAYGQLLQGLITPAKFVSVFQEDMPFLPLGYRAGMAAFARALRTSDIRRNDLFAGIADWSF